MPPDHIARTLPEDVGYAGFRIMNPKQTSDWLAFLGPPISARRANRTSTAFRRAPSPSTRPMPTPEEFPRFTEFYMEPVDGDSDHIVINALMEGPSVTAPSGSTARSARAW